MRKPMLFVDVDGVLNRLIEHGGPGGRAQAEAIGIPRGLVRHEVTEDGGRTFPLWMDPADKARLESMADDFELAWGTTWTHQAATRVSPLIDLDTSAWPVATPKMSDYSKLPGVARLADGRRFVWLDDNLDYYDGRHLDEMPNAHWVVVDSTTGLTDEHLVAAREALESLVEDVAL